MSALSTFSLGRKAVVMTASVTLLMARIRGLDDPTQNETLDLEALP